MSLSITAFNEKLNNPTQLSKSIFSKTNIIKASLMILLGSISQTVKFNLGIVFILPLLSLVIKLDRRWGYGLASIIGLSVIWLDFYSGLSIVLGMVLLISFSSGKQLMPNYFTLLSIALLTYGVNVFLDVTELNIFVVGFIAIYTYIFYYIFNQALEIKMFNITSDRSLFSEEIVAILAVIASVLIGLYFIEISLINVGFLVTCFVIIVLGIISSSLYTISFSVVIFLLMTYSNAPFMGVELLPFLGVIAAVIPKKHNFLKTLAYFMLAPIMYLVGIIDGNILYIMANLFLATSIGFLLNDYLYPHYSTLLVHRNSETNLINMYMDNFKEETSKRLLNFAEIFETFAYKSTESNLELQKIDDSINEIFDKHCRGCLKRELCLNTNYIKTYNYFSEILKEGNGILDASKQRFIELFNLYCLNSYDVISTAIDLNKEYMLNNTKTESLIYQSQLQGLSQIIQNYALELNSQYLNDNEKILKFKESLNKLGIYITYLKINTIKKYNIHVELGVDVKEPIDNDRIQTIFEEIFEESVDFIELSSKKGKIRYKILSKKELDIEFGTSYIGKDGKRISGDNFIKCDNYQGNTVVALCDGMGSGYSAHVESKTTLELLSKMLETGADDQMSVSVINTLVSLKEYKERFSTLDYLVVNRSNKTVTFYKIGSAPSFILRGNKVIRIDNDNLPVGFSETIDEITLDIQENDVIIMASDGIVERFSNITKFESILTKLSRNSSIQMAHDIIQATIKESGGKIIDDMTSIVLKIGKSDIQ